MSHGLVTVGLDHRVLVRVEVWSAINDDGENEENENDDDYDDDNGDDDNDDDDDDFDDDNDADDCLDEGLVPPLRWLRQGETGSELGDIIIIIIIVTLIMIIMMIIIIIIIAMLGIN